MIWNIFCKSGNSDFNFIFHDSVSRINSEHWKKAVSSKNIYLSFEYLKALEEAMKGTMEFRYILFYNKDRKPVAAAAVQLLSFSGQGSEYEELLSRAGVKTNYKLPGAPGIKVMICGNIFACGENGFAHTNAISEEEAYEILGKSLTALSRSEKTKGEVSLVLLKDFWPHSFVNSDVLKEANYRDFMIDVNMVLKLHKSWNTIDDYLDSMTTKFRTKAKGVFKKSDGITVVDFSKDDIANHQARIEELHSNVVEKAGFTLRALNGDAFFNFKKELNGDFIFKGYFFRDKLVGFSSAFAFDHIIDANYVGIDYDFNQEHAVYQRMLYDFVELAIFRKAAELRLGRTAEEIKSSIGAEPSNMKLYVKHGNRISNKLLKPLIESIAPGEFELRRPFKQVQDTAGENKKPTKKQLLHSE